MSLKDAMDGILKEYKKLEKEASARGQRKFRMTRDHVKDVAAWLKQGRDFKDGQYYFSYREFINALGRFKLITTRTIYQDGERELRGFIGKKN